MSRASNKKHSQLLESRYFLAKEQTRQKKREETMIGFILLTYNNLMRQAEKLLFRNRCGLEGREVTGL